MFGRRRRRGFGRRRRGGERRPRRRDPRPGRSSTGVRPPGWRRRPTGARSQPRPRARRVARAQPPSRARRASRGRGFRRRGDEGGVGGARRRGSWSWSSSWCSRGRRGRSPAARASVAASVSARIATRRIARDALCPRHATRDIRRSAPSPRRHEALVATTRQMPISSHTLHHVACVTRETTFHASVSGGVSSRPSSRVPFASSHTTTSQNVLYGK